MDSMKKKEWLPAFLLLLLTAPPLGAGGGGGCVAAGTRIATPAGEVAVENLRVGDMVWNIANGQLTPARVDALFSVEPDEFFEITLQRHTLRVTAEHPVQAASGVF